MLESTALDLADFEASAYQKRYEHAARLLKALLIGIDRTNGLAEILRFNGQSEEHDLTIVNRLAAAIAALFADPGFQLSGLGYREIINWHRWIAAVFAASAFRNSDHILQVFNIAQKKEAEYTIDPKNLLKFCLLYGPDSRIPLQVDALWAFDPVLAVGLCMALVSPRFLGSDEAHEKRELILPWLSEKLLGLDSITGLPEQVLHDVYMHCTYAHQRNRHSIKNSINELIGKWLTSQNQIKIENPQGTSKEGDLSRLKPTMIVVIEWFTSTHSIYRTHSRTIEGCRKRFRVIGMGYERSIDSVAAKVFDTFIPIKDGRLDEQIQQVSEECQANSAQVLYMPSIGMSPLTIFLSNLRLTEIQLVSLGHPATTHAKQIDYVVVEEDYVGDPSLFSEKLLKLPSNGMPYRPTNEMLSAVQPAKKTKQEPVQIVICASSMKINPLFLQTCHTIRSNTSTPVHFHFLIAGAVGLVYANIKRVIGKTLGDSATVHPQLGFTDYLDTIGKADLFLNPFPFGNTNGIVDCAWQGLIGVAMKGPEVFESIDAALFARMKWPTWLIASDTETYIESSVRLIEQKSERQRISARVSGRKAVEEHIFNGNSEVMGELIHQELLTKIQTASNAET